MDINRISSTFGSWSLLGILITAVGLAVPLATAEAAGTNKVTICHIPPGNPANSHSITISESAWPAHRDNHGDYMGVCDGDEGVPGEVTEGPAEFSICDSRVGETGRRVYVGVNGQPSSSRVSCS